jgi:hypothetical protein
VAKVDSDVVHLFFRVLPALAPGVLVHFHDIPWRFEYPRTWLEQGKAWNEAYLLRAFLMYNPAFEVHWYAAFLADRHLAALTRALPTAVRPPSAPTMLSHSSIWLRKVAGAAARQDPDGARSGGLRSGAHSVMNVNTVNGTSGTSSDGLITQ